MMQGMIDFALTLDLEKTPRISRNGDDVITLHKKVFIERRDRTYLILLCNRFGYDDASEKYRKQIVLAAATQYAYDHGYRKPVTSYERFKQWHKDWMKDVRDAKVFIDKRQRQSYLLTIDNKYPGYICNLYREATRTLGAVATFKELAQFMKNVSKNGLIHLHGLNAMNLYRWFKLNKGKEYKPVEKPLDTINHCRERMRWVDKYYDILTKPNYHVVYLDEKWFYTTNRRKRIKRLPLQSHEKPGDDFIPQPKIRSRRFPIKCMFMGVVGRPIPERNFDGKILLERVSTEKIRQMGMADTNFDHKIKVNEDLKNGGWKELINDSSNDVTVEELLTQISIFYDLDNDVSERLELQMIKEGNKYDILPANFVVNIDNVKRMQLKVRNKKGDSMQVDCSCDSKFMLKIMNKVGSEIRKKYHWVDSKETIYLVMDQAGVHGTKEVIETYTKTMKSTYNIEIIRQVPRSPYTNILDLGFWCSLQSEVQKKHYGKLCKVEAPVDSVYRTWDSDILSNVLVKVCNRLQKVLCLIVSAKGANDLVEKKRGKKGGEMNLRSDEELVKIMNEFKAALENLDESGVTDELIDDVLDDDDLLHDEEI